ncbi:MAG: LLM class flavin-dependent oxidoreductase [Myxococcales bacterium]|nr:LLM class flavin-dependent oxidoreductase [Myxococcales bacterium]
MQLGLMTLGDWLPDPATRRHATPQAGRQRNFVEQAVWAEAAGFHSVHLGEHHFSEYILSAPPVVLAAIAERTERIRLSTATTLAANLDPLRVAEDYATVDQLSNGRVELVMGKGAFSDTFRTFGQPWEEADPRYVENVELLLRVWSEEEVSCSPRFRAPLRSITVQPRPLQRPHPPVWIGSAGASVDLAARNGLPLMLPSVFGPAELFQPARDRYLERWEAHGRDPADARVGTCAHCFVARDSQEARRRWLPYYDQYLRWAGALLASQHQPMDFDWRAESFIDEVAMCGSPAQLVERIGKLRESLGTQRHLVMFDPGGLPEAELRECIELFGSEVMPALAD